jgi:hypothetical protein
VSALAVSGSTLYVGGSFTLARGTNLKTWIPLQTNVLGNSSLYFSDSQLRASEQRFYRARVLP